MPEGARTAACGVWGVVLPPWMEEWNRRVNREESIVKWTE